MYRLKTGQVCTCNCNQRMDQPCLAALLNEGLVPNEESDGESIMDERAVVPENFTGALRGKAGMVNSDETIASSKDKSLQNLSFVDTINENANLTRDPIEKSQHKTVAPMSDTTKPNPELEDDDPEQRMSTKSGCTDGAVIPKLHPELEDGDDNEESRMVNMKTGCTVAGIFYTFPFSTFGSFCRCTEHGMLWCWKGGVPSCLGCLVDGLHFSPSSSYTLASGTVCTCTCSQQMDNKCHEGPLDSKPWKGMAWHIE